MVAKEGGIGLVVTLESIGAVAGDGSDHIRATQAIGEFCDGACRSVTLNLNASHNKITNGIRHNLAGIVDPCPMGSTAVLSKQPKDAFSELGLGGRLTKKVVGVLRLMGGRIGRVTEAEVERKTKGAADGWNAADNVSAVNWAAVPSVCSRMGCLDKNGVSAAIVSGDGDGFVQKTMELFDTNCFVITLSGDVDSYTKEGTNGVEGPLKGAAIVHNNDAAKSDFEENLLHEKTSKVVRCNVRGSIDNDKTCKVTHNIEEVGSLR